MYMHTNNDLSIGEGFQKLGPNATDR